MAMYHGYVSWLCILAVYHGYVSWLYVEPECRPAGAQAANPRSHAIFRKNTAEGFKSRFDTLER